MEVGKGAWVVRYRSALAHSLRASQLGSGDLIGVAVWIGGGRAKGAQAASQNVVLHCNRFVVCPEPDSQLNGNVCLRRGMVNSQTVADTDSDSRIRGYGGQW